MLDQTNDLDGAFRALADPSPCFKVERFTLGPASVSELTRPLAMPLSAWFQHMQVFEACGVVTGARLADQTKYDQAAPGRLPLTSEQQLLVTLDQPVERPAGIQLETSVEPQRASSTAARRVPAGRRDTSQPAHVGGGRSPTPCPPERPARYTAGRGPSRWHRTGRPHPPRPMQWRYASPVPPHPSPSRRSAPDHPPRRHGAQV
jgi:hypothetical protein